MSPARFAGAPRRSGRAQASPVHSAPAVRSSRRAGETIVIIWYWSVKGGVGTSVVAAATAVRLASDHHDATLSTASCRFCNAETPDGWRLDYCPRAHRGIKHHTAVRRVDHEVRVHDEAQATPLPATPSIDRPTCDAQGAHPLRIDPGRRGGTGEQHALGFVQAHLEVAHAPGAGGHGHAPPPEERDRVSLDARGIGSSITVSPCHCVTVSLSHGLRNTSWRIDRPSPPTGHIQTATAGPP